MHSTITNLLATYSYLFLVLLVGIESFGVPLPGETVLIAGALVAAQGKIHIAEVLLAAWAGAVLGDNLGYAIGRFGGRRLVLRYGWYLHVTEARVHRVEDFFRRRGIVIVVLARFIEVLRQLNGIVAGIGGMPWWRFLACNATGAVLWVGMWGYLTYRLTHRLRYVHHVFAWIGPVVIAVSLLLSLVLILLHRRRGKT